MYIKPSIFVIGSPKCGTSYLYNLLKNHPEIVVSKIKELNFFSYDELKKKSYYDDFKIKMLDDYLPMFKKNKKSKVSIDFSVSYFTNEAAIKKIKLFNEKSKLIILTRDPLERAFSHYKMDYRMGLAPKPLIYYLENNNTYHYRQYIENSLFYKNYMMCLKYFNAEDILTCSLNEIDSKLYQIQSFCGLSYTMKLVANEKNEAKSARNKIGAFVLRKRSLISKIKPNIPNFITPFIKELIYSKPKKINITKKEKALIKSLTDKDFKMFNKL